MKNLVRFLPAQTQLGRAILGVDAEWGLAEQLAATLLDAVRAGNWQRGGGKGPKPKPVPRPGVDNPRETSMLGTAMPLEDIKARLDLWTAGGLAASDDGTVEVI